MPSDDRSRSDRRSSRSRSRSRSRDRHISRNRDRDRSGDRSKDRSRSRGRRDRDRDRSRDRHRRSPSPDDTPNETPIFVSNFSERESAKDLERIFSKFGKVDRVEMKMRFAFVYMPLRREANEAIRNLNRAYAGESSVRLRVEFTRGDGQVKRREEKRREIAKRQPNTTLFVVNFDADRTRTRDLEDAFGPYGQLVRADIKRNFAFVEYKNLDDAIKAKEELNGKQLGDGLGVIVVEYQARIPTGRSRSPVRRRSPSPRGRQRSPSREGAGRAGRDGSARRGSRSPR